MATSKRVWREATQERLLANIVLDEKTNCWLWLGRLNSNGYGMAGNNYAHRLSYLLFKGNLNTYHVLHRCNKPQCINPAHLYLGSKSDNAQDCRDAGRLNVQKLNWDSVRKIRLLAPLGYTHQRIAEMFNISRANVTMILNNKTWIERTAPT